MERVDQAIQDLKEMDELAMGDSPVHRFSAGVKLLVTVVYILTVVSFPVFDFSGLMMMIFYPVILFNLSGLSFRTCLYKLRFILPLVLFVGLFNPLLDHRPFLHLGNITITAGMVSMLTLMMKGVLCLSASWLLAATTRIEAICAVLRKIHVPDLLVTLILLTSRYLSVLLEEASLMNEAYHLRAPGQKGIHISAWGSFFGQLLLRTIDRGQELYEAMLLRGYHGEFPHAVMKKTERRDVFHALIWLLFCLVFRCVDFPVLLGSLFVR